MQFLWAHNEFDDLKLSLLFLNNGIPVTAQTTPFWEVEEQSIIYSQTFGPYATYSLDDAGLTLAAYYQGGKDGNEDKLRAWYGRGAYIFFFRFLARGFSGPWEDLSL